MVVESWNGGGMVVEWWCKGGEIVVEWWKKEWWEE